MAQSPTSGPTRRKVVLKRRHLVAIAAALVPLGAAAAAYVVFVPDRAEANTQVPAPSLPPGPLPVAVVETSRPLGAVDYEIVSIYGDEAILLAGTNLVRLKVGSTAPGLGTVTAIAASAEGGGSLTATGATLRTQ